MQHIYQVDSAAIFSLGPLGFAVTSAGKVVSTGWTNSQLRPRFYVVPPADGILDIDFYADEPTGIVLPYLSPIAASRVFNRNPANYWGKGTPLVGVRVHSATNEIEIKYDPKLVQEGIALTAETMGTDGMGSPWPFPWNVSPRTFGGTDPFPFLTKNAKIDCSASLCELLGKSLRVYRTGDVLTLDYLVDRANIELDPKTLRIVDVWFG